MDSGLKPGSDFTVQLSYLNFISSKLKEQKIKSGDPIKKRIMIAGGKEPFLEFP
jgi:hypothetical protein